MNNVNLQFLTCKGPQIINESGEIIYLRGVCFGNEVWHNDTIPTEHHGESDYERVRGWGMNVVRFYLNHKSLADNEAPGNLKNPAREWLDTNITWAKKYGIYVIFNMHIPPGGSQARGQGEALWDNPVHRDHLRFLWKAIAARYSGESTVAGYGLLNQPVPNVSLDQWQVLAQNIIDDIRMVDKRHIVFIERAISVRDHDKEDDNCHFPVVRDDNVAYEFHVTQPYNFTRQLLSYACPGDGGKYPDESRFHYINEAKGHDNSTNPVFPRNKSYLKASIIKYTRWIEAQSAPAYMGEFGTSLHSFKDNKGGERWVGDVLDIAHELGLHYTYHAYHDNDFGIYCNQDGLPDEGSVNTVIVELMKEKLL
ncbi:MAG: cellulase family glycosylhydrolase [Spirochaetales bacterium]|nr:cellulase family glycosylhydrolase [Spirochaetales bacterium]